MKKKEYWKIMSLTAWKKLIIFVTTSSFTNSLRKYEKYLLQNMYWKRFVAPQRFIYEIYIMYEISVELNTFSIT